MTYHRERGNREGFALAALDHYKNYPSDDAYELNDVAWTFYQVISDKKQLKGATKLVKQSMKIESGYFNHDTLAALYSKMGKKAKALKTARKAIEIAKANNEDYSTTVELIQQIESEGI